jgi:peptidoglycan/LPS O-acetylase OafA/YrhL
VKEPRDAPAWHLGYQPGLDGLRAIAVSLVVLSHLGVPFFSGGGIGVDIFFVLSGFLITGLLLEERRRYGGLSYGTFYLRRSLRLFPALAVFLPVIVIAAQLAPTIDSTVRDQTVHGVLWVVLYVANWARAFGVQVGLFGHTWSLAIEEQFYLVWPVTLMALVGRRLSFRRAIAICLVGVVVVAVHRAVAWSSGEGVDRVANGTDMRADALLIGCVLALGLHAELKLRPPRILAALAAGFIAWFVATQSNLSGFTYVGGITIVSAAAAVIIMASLGNPGVLALRPLVWLGRISYGVYLWHFPIVFLVPTPWATPVRVAVVVSLTLACASASWWLVERRFLRLKPYRQRPSRSAARIRVGADG